MLPLVVAPVVLQALGGNPRALGVSERERLRKAGVVPVEKRPRIGSE